METGIQHLHNFMRWLVILFGLWTLIKAASGMGGNKPFSSAEKRPAKFLLISVDTQFLLGLYLYVSKGWLKMLATGGVDMKNAIQRFWSLEHMLGMLIGIILIHMGANAIKKDIADQAKFKKVFWFTLIGMVLILATIPWPFKAEVGRALFPGM